MTGWVWFMFTLCCFMGIGYVLLSLRLRDEIRHTRIMQGTEEAVRQTIRLDYQAKILRLEKKLWDNTHQYTEDIPNLAVNELERVCLKAKSLGHDPQQLVGLLDSYLDAEEKNKG